MGTAVGIAGIAFFVGLVFTPFQASAESARSLVASGNEHYEAGEIDKAMESYEKAEDERPQAGEILFNKGDVYFQKGDYDKAREAYQEAALNTKDLSLEAAAHYNLGNTLFEAGQKQLEADPKKALSQYEQSVLHYREALRGDPHLKEAAQNIEAVRLRMKDLEEKIKKAEEAAQQQKQQDKKKDEEKQKQPNEADKNGQDQQKEEKSQGGEQEKKPPEEQAGAEDKAEHKANEKKEESKAAEQKQEERQGGQKSDEQKGLSEQKEDDQKGDEQKVSSAFSESPENILREEKENRIQLYRAPQGGINPVDKDW